MARLEERLLAVARDHGAVLAAEAEATIAAGGKRCARCCVFLAAGRCDSAGVLRSAVAVELVHSATLVHDDVLDAAVVRRGAAHRGRAVGPRDGHRDGRPAVLARVRRAGLNGRADELRVLSRASSALALGRAGPARRRVECRHLGRALPVPLRAEDRPPVRGRRRARRAGGRRPAAELGAFGRSIGLGLPAARRRARRLGSRGANGQAARHRPARRHGHPAAHPRA